MRRRPDVALHDVFLLRTDAGEPDLSDAIRTLLVARQVGGDTAKTAATLRIRQRQGAHGVPRELPWVPRVLADLRRAELQEVSGVGRARAVHRGTHRTDKRGVVRDACALSR